MLCSSKICSLTNPGSSPLRSDDPRRALRPQSPPLSTIEEENPHSNNGGWESPPDTPSSLEQARDYQRALIEAMPSSIADGFTRASVLLPVRSHDQASEFENAPLMRHETIDESITPGGCHEPEEQDELEQAPLLRHETNVVASAYDEHNELDQAPLMRHETTGASPADESLDELDRAPLMQFETNLGLETAHADIPGPRLSYGTTLVDEDNDADDELAHGTEPDNSEQSTRSSSSAERMMFPMDTSNPPTVVGPDRSSSVYSNDGNELDRAPTLPHETPEWINDEGWLGGCIHPPVAPNSNDGVTYYEADDSGGEGVDELDTSPMLPHEAMNVSVIVPAAGADGTSSERDATGCSDADTASERSKARRIINGEDDLLSTSKTNSFTSDRLREAFKTSIFGATRRPTLPRDAPSENDLDSGAAPLLAHERTDILHDRSSGDGLSIKDGSSRQPTTEAFEISSFARRASSTIFRSQGSNLPHSIPRSDADDSDLRDPSLEVFPMERDQLFGRVRDISNRLAEDQVQSPNGGLDSPVVVSVSGSSVNLGPIRSTSTMSLHSIREDASENEDDPPQVPSPVLMLASRVPRSMPIPIAKGEAVGRFQGATKKRAGLIPEESDDPDDTQSKRFGKVFDTVSLPPQPPEANVPLPPKSSSVSFIESDNTNRNRDAKQKHRALTPYPHEDTSDDEVQNDQSIGRKICAPFRACFSSRNAR
jgi:hypothetical protein